MDRPPRCFACDDVIGVYEPIVVFSGGVAEVTSIAREALPAVEDLRIAHYDCAPLAVFDDP